MGQVVRVTLPRVPTQKTKWTLRWREVKIICGGGQAMMIRLSGEMREPHRNYSNTNFSLCIFGYDGDSYNSYIHWITSTFLYSKMEKRQVSREMREGYGGPVPT